MKISLNERNHYNFYQKWVWEYAAQHGFNFFISIVFIISCFVHKRKVRKEAFVDKKADYTTRRQHIITCSLNAISGSCLSTIDNTLNALLTSTTRTLTRPFEEIWGTFWACSFTICIGLFACLDKGVIQPSNYMLQGRSSHWISLTTFWIKTFDCIVCVASV